MCLASQEWIQQVHKLHFFPRKSKRSRIRVLRLSRRKRISEDMELKNLKLYMENMSIVKENEKLRKQASLLHQENLALMSQFQNKFSKSDFVSISLNIMLRNQEKLT